jgi:IclR family transcriptional regulator, acetate operon repressor
MKRSKKNSALPSASKSDPNLKGKELPASAAEKSLRVLGLLAREGRALSLAELASSLSIPKGTAHRICTQLLETGYLSRDLEQRFYSVGIALRQLAFDTLNNGVERGQRHAILDALVREVAETCNFTTLDGAQVLYLDRVEADWPLRLHLQIGTHVPLHCTASGKLFLAMMPSAQREALLDTLPLTALTKNTLTNSVALRNECKLIVERGYSTDREEFMTGLIAVAVPVLDPQGQARAAIAIHAPTARMSLSEAISKLPALRASAKKMQSLI